MSLSPEKRKDILDRYREDVAAHEKLEGHSPGLTICMDIGCWQPARETWQEFLHRKGLLRISDSI